MTRKKLEKVLGELNLKGLNTKGCCYLIDAIIYYNSDPKKYSTNKIIYSEIAKKYKIQINSVQRAIRYFTETNREQLQKTLGNIKITNKYLIRILERKAI